MKSIATLFLIIAAFSLVEAQDLTSFKGQKPVRFSGGLSLRAGFYNTPDGGQARRSPWNWAVSGSPTLAIYGWSMPFSFTFHQQKFAYSQPFQRVGVSPRWKWLTLHGGYRNLTFSNYTLAGHTFLGGGIEIRPKKFRLSAMFGTMQNALIQSDTAVLGSRFLQTYKRRGYGLKIGAGKEANHFDLQFFRAFDRQGTERLDSATRRRLHPADNLTFGPAFRFTFFRHLVLESSAAASLFTRDVNFYDFDSIDNEAVQKAKAFGERFMRVNVSTRFSWAGDASLRLQFSKWNLGVKYQRIQPFFTSFGAYYFQDDVENRTLTAGLRLFKNKINVSGSVGQQRNNLSGLRSLTAARLIGNGSLTWSPSPKWGISAQFSNFRAEQQAGFQNVADTFRFVQVNKMVSLSPYFNKSDKRFSHFVSVNLSRQVFDDLSEGTSVLPQNSTSRNAFFSYRLSLKKTGWRLGLGGNFNQFKFANQQTGRQGGTLSAGRSLFKKKLQLDFSSTFNVATAAGLANGTVQNHRLSMNVKASKRHSFQASVLALWRNLPGKAGYSEQSGSVGYHLRF